MKLSIAFLIALSVGTALAQNATPDSGASIDVYKGPQLKKLYGDPYPTGALRAGREGWVVLNLMVDQQGKPYEVGVVDSLGGRAFEIAAVHAIERSEFKPARSGDKPVDSALLFKVKFSISNDEGGARREFRTEYANLNKAVKAGDRAAADAASDAMKPENFYEAAYFSLAMYEYHRKWGTAAQQLRDLEDAIAGEDGPKYLTKLEFAAVLAAMLKMQVERNDLGAALDTWRKLEPVATDQQKRQWAPVLAEIRRLQTVDSPLALRGEVGALGAWSDILFRRRFHITVQSGQISELRLRCEKGYLFFKYDPALEYSLKGHEGQCRLELTGDPGSRFTLVQT